MPVPHRRCSTLDGEQDTFCTPCRCPAVQHPSPAGSEALQDEASAPLVLVEGFMCAASSLIWGDFPQELAKGAAASLPSKGGARPGQPRKIIWAPIGPVSSLHDRACELFYSLAGGTVDYGEDHAKEHGHSRWGRRYPSAALGGGSYPRWSVKYPVHMIGHSLGGVTILKLRQLLLTGFFDKSLDITTPPGCFSQAAALIRSITTISSPLRGTPLVYLLGERPTASPQVRFLSFGDVLAKSVHVAVWLRAHSESMRRLLPDPQADAWQFSGADALDGQVDDLERAATQKEGHSISKAWSFRSLWGLPMLLAQLRKSDWAEGRDCAPWDCTLAERARCEGQEVGWLLNNGCETSGEDAPQLPDCWFRSYAASMTELCTPSPSDAVASTRYHHRPSSAFRASLSAALLNITSRQIGTFDYRDARPSQLFGTSCLSPAEGSSSPDSGYASPRAGQEQGRADRAADAMRTAAMTMSVDEKVSLHEQRGEEEEWYANDGVVPLGSQYHPGSCASDTCIHYEELPSPELNPAYEVGQLDVNANLVTRRPALSRLMSVGDAAWRRVRGEVIAASTATTDSQSSACSEETKDTETACRSSMVPNKWHVYVLRDATHASLCPLWHGNSRQRHFWRGVGAWLAQVDALSTQSTQSTQ